MEKARILAKAIASAAGAFLIREAKSTARLFFGYALIFISFMAVMYVCWLARYLFMMGGGKWV